jgi:hypothetical protein
MKYLSLACGISIALIVLSSSNELLFAQEKKPLTAEEIDRLQSLQDLMHSLDALQVAADRLTQAKYHDCLKAFGHTVFCECLRDTAPVAIGFQTYVRIITTNKQELNYNQLNEEDKKIVDATHKARETCVGRLRASR